MVHHFSQRENAYIHFIWMMNLISSAATSLLEFIPQRATTPTQKSKIMKNDNQK